MSQVKRPNDYNSQQFPRRPAAVKRGWRLDRRNFLKVAGLSAAAAAATSAVGGLHALAESLGGAPEEFPAQGPESFVASICGLCPARCGMTVRKIGRRVVKVEGNVLDPVNQGGLCAVGQANLQLLYNPDRVRSPLKRLGERGSGRWQVITWQEALELIKANLNRLSTGPGAHTLAALSDGTSELADRLMVRLLQAYGSPNFIYGKGAAPSHGQDLMQGMSGRVGYDFENARYILSFGAPLLETWMSPVRQMRALGEFRQGWPGQRGKLVQIESRLSTTAARADEWIPVNPGTEGVLALGIASVLVRYNLYNADFVTKHVAGMDRWPGEKGPKASGFRGLVLEQYETTKVSQITGVPVEVILRLAHEFASFHPSLALPGDLGFDPLNRKFRTVAVQSLNALAGNIDQPGGVLVRPEPPLGSWVPVKSSPSATGAAKVPHLDSLEALALAVNDKTPYPINVLFLLGANPIFASQELSRATLDRIPFIVSFTPLLDDTAASADLVLPDTTSLERWELRTGSPGVAINCVAVGSAALAPRYNSRPASQVFLDLAHAMGGEVAASLPWEEPEHALRELVAGLYTSPHGEVFTEPFSKQYLRPEVRGWDWPARKFDSRDDFLKALSVQGGWVDPRYKFGDYTRVLRGGPGGKVLLPELLANEAVSNHFERAKLWDYPLELNVFQAPALMGEPSANLPYLQEIVGSPQEWFWDSYVEINPQTAAALGLSSGDEVIVQSPAGEVKTRVLIYAGVMPNVVNMAVGQGHVALGRWASKRGFNPLDLLAGGAVARLRTVKA